VCIYEHHKYRGQIWAKFRMAPSGKQILGNVLFSVTMGFEEETPTGEFDYQIREARLEFTPTVIWSPMNVRVHLNGKDQPFAGMSMDKVKEKLDSIGVFVSGFDEVNGRMVIAAEYFEMDRLMYDCQFDDYLYRDPNDPNQDNPTNFIANWARINTVIRAKRPLPPPSPPPPAPDDTNQDNNENEEAELPTKTSAGNIFAIQGGHCDLHRHKSPPGAQRQQPRSPPPATGTHRKLLGRLRGPQRSKTFHLGRNMCEAGALEAVVGEALGLG